VQFEVLDRIPIDAEALSEAQMAFLEGTGPLPNLNNFFTGGPQQPEDWEAGHKDTVIAPPSFVTRIKAHFDLPGLYVWHCHILEHEDNEMMRPYEVIAP
jgi:FtsP/CotA-like multicopper oxidase with cupredoxin domain